MMCGVATCQGGGSLGTRKRTPKKDAQYLFIAALGETPNVSRACVLAGIGRRTAYEWREEDPAFAAMWDDALEAACDELEAVARARAVESSDTLLIFLLKAHRPEKYRETTKHEHSGPGGEPIRFDFRNLIAEVTSGSGEDRESGS